MSRSFAKHFHPRLILLTLALVATCTYSTVATWSTPTNDIPDTAEELVDYYEQLLSYQPFLERRNIDPDKLFNMMHARFELAREQCPDNRTTCLPLLTALRDLFGSFRNGHTSVSLPYHTGHPDWLTVEPIEDQPVVTFVSEGSPAARAGVRAGMRILSVDGVAVEDALVACPSWAVAYEAPHKRRRSYYDCLLEGAPRTRVELVAQLPGEEPRTFNLLRYPYLSPDEEDDEDEDSFSAMILADGLAILSIYDFDGADFRKHFDDTLNRLRETPGMVIDLRGNGGGYLDTMKAVLSRFIGEPLHLGESCSLDEWGDLVCEDSWVQPRGRLYPGRLAVLIDSDSISAAELFAYALCSTYRARCFGRPTAGETNSVLIDELPAAMVGVAISEFHPASGELIQGHGVEPHERIEWSIQDVVEGNDPDMDAALLWVWRGGIQNWATRAFPD